jgi:hypothetical protein
MRPIIVTTIPVKNGERFILRTLRSLARQTRPPDRVIVLDNWSTDGTCELVGGFNDIALEFIQCDKPLSAFDNHNRCLDFAAEAEYLHILHADDCIAPRFYEVMSEQLADCNGVGMAWSLDERIDENDEHISLSGKPDGNVRVFELDGFLAQKAEICNQAFSATLLKSSFKPVPVRFPLDMPIFGDVAYWAMLGMHCRKIVRVNLPLAQYRWHGSNESNAVAPDIDSLIRDLWKTMMMVEGLRRRRPGRARLAKLKGLLAVRAGINARRFRQRGNAQYAREIVRAARSYTGAPLWYAGQLLVELRELMCFQILRRKRHPMNIFS